jgi:hypothetical protein
MGGACGSKHEDVPKGKLLTSLDAPDVQKKARSSVPATPTKKKATSTPTPRPQQSLEPSVISSGPVSIHCDSAATTEIEDSCETLLKKFNPPISTRTVCHRNKADELASRPPTIRGVELVEDIGTVPPSPPRIRAIHGRARVGLGGLGGLVGLGGRREGPTRGERPLAKGHVACTVALNPVSERSARPPHATLARHGE